MLFVFLAILPNPYVTRTHVDRIEVNRFCSDYGGEQFAQVILWDWSPKEKCYHVVAWRLMKDAHDATDAEHKKKWEAARDKWLEGSRAEVQIRYLKGLQYKGKFVGGKWYPRREGGRWVIRCRDEGDNGTPATDRVIVAPVFIETFGRVDPERVDRSRLPECQRRGLR